MWDLNTNWILLDKSSPDKSRVVIKSNAPLYEQKKKKK